MMVETLTRHPSGKVSEVFRRPNERQAAYDALEHSTYSVAAIQGMAFRETASQCRGLATVYVALDGSSLSLTDAEGTKFGSIGSGNKAGRGIKMLNALAISLQGGTLGLLGQKFWSRTERAKRGKYRPLAERESYRWHQALGIAVGMLKEQAPGTRPHVLADREGDASLLMRRILDLGADFTIRANGTRKVVVGGRRVDLRGQLKKLAPLVTHRVPVRSKETGRIEREATLAVRAAKVTVVLRDHLTGVRGRQPLTAVWARETGAPRGARAVEWLLYTTVPVPDAAAALDCLVRYGYRWRVEDFHRMLKSGGGQIEDTQLRSENAVQKWATLHAMVAARAQDLRDASRSTPDSPASSHLSPAEIEALVLLKTDEKRQNEVITAEGLSLVTAVRWIADLGGFTATGRSKTPPGAIVIARGLERVLEMVNIVRLLRASGKMR